MTTEPQGEKQQRKRVLHVHVPKTGGSWFTHVMNLHLGKAFTDGQHSAMGLIASDMQIPLWMRVHEDTNIEYTLHLTGRNKKTGELASNWLIENDVIRVGIVRNPFDMLVSYYRHDHRDDRINVKKMAIDWPDGSPIGWDKINVIHGIHSFDEFVKRICCPEFKWHHRQMQNSLFHQLLGLKNNPVQVILRTEFLEFGTRALLHHAGWDINEEHLATNPINVSSQRKDYRSYYTDELRELVETSFGSDIERFGYSFDGLINDEPANRVLRCLKGEEEYPAFMDVEAKFSL